MTQAIHNPVKYRSLLPLLPAEASFIADLKQGKPCLVGNGKLPNKPIPHGGKDNPANVIRPEIIRFFAYGGNDDHPVLGSTICLLGAWIPGKRLDLENADIPYALQLYRCHFAAVVNMKHAKCSGLYLGESHLSKGLSADGIKVKGNVSLRPHFSSEDEVRFLGANIDGSLECLGGKFSNSNPQNFALIADGMTVTNQVALCDGFSAKGGVRMSGANIGGNLDCVGGKFVDPAGWALVAENITVKGDVFLSDGFSAESGVWMRNANIGRDLCCIRGKFINPGKLTLVAQNANIGGGLLWAQTTGSGTVHLGHAKVKVLADVLPSWESFKVILDGFSYDRFLYYADAKSRIDWLAKFSYSSPPYEQAMKGDWLSESSFSPLPYEQAAKVLFGMGHDSDAREILLEKERLQTKDEQIKQPRKFLRQLWNIFAGYGYRLRYTAAWMILFVSLGALLFNFADNNGRMVPHQPLVLTNHEYKKATIPPCVEFKCPPEKRPTEVVKHLFPDYPEFNAFVYSLDVFIPFFALHQEQYWYPNPSDADKEILLQILPFWYWLEIGFGWFLTSLFLLSATGLLRPRQSSDGKD